LYLQGEKEWVASINGVKYDRAYYLNIGRKRVWGELVSSGKGDRRGKKKRAWEQKRSGKKKKRITDQVASRWGE